MAKRKPEKISEVSLAELAVAYATGTEARGRFTHGDGHEEWIRLRVHALREAVAKQGSWIRCVEAEIERDLNRPGMDPGDDRYWNRVLIHFNESYKAGKVFQLREHHGKKK